MEQEAPIHQNHVYRRIKNSRTIFEKGLLKNISVKLFQNRTAVPEEKTFKELLKKFHFQCHGNQSFDGIKFCEHF